jgi:hypothetical protein
LTGGVQKGLALPGQNAGKGRLNFPLNKFRYNAAELGLRIQKLRAEQAAKPVTKRECILARETQLRDLDDQFHLACAGLVDVNRTDDQHWRRGIFEVHPDEHMNMEDHAQRGLSPLLQDTIREQFIESRYRIHARNAYAKYVDGGMASLAVNQKLAQWPHVPGIPCITRVSPCLARLGF